MVPLWPTQNIEQGVFAILISSFPPCEGTGYKLDEIRKQSLENWYFKKLPRKNQECFLYLSPHGKSYRGAAACPKSQRDNILSAYVMLGSVLTDPRTPAQNNQSSQVKNESEITKISIVVVISQQPHK